MKQYIRHIILIFLTIFSVIQNIYAQNIRYVQYNSTHALYVPENPDYWFEWSMTWGNTNIPITINDSTNVTSPIKWDRNNTHYDITVYPKLKSVGCVGEPIYMTVYTVDYLSLHAFDDVFHIQKNDTLRADVSRNDFDEMGYNLIYNTAPVVQTKYGTLTLEGWGKFTYTPNPGFEGIDYFEYEVSNDANPSMSDNALVTIVVRDDDKISDLYIEKTGPAKALYGDNIQYNIIVKNNGPDTVENVVINDILPFGLFKPEYSLSGPKKPWEGHLEIGTLNPNDSVLLLLFALISPNSPKTIYNQGLTYSNFYDPDITDNDSIWFTEISALFVDLPDQLRVPGCESITIPNNVGHNNNIKSYLWRPATGLSDSTIANPVFTPDILTAGTTISYVLFVTDINGNIASDTIKLIVSEVPLAIIESDTLYRNKGEDLFIDGSLSTGNNLDFFWWNNAGKGHVVPGYETAEATKVDSIGYYYLEVIDQQNCKSYDSVLVLYRSNPPVAINNYVEIEAGKDSVINVLRNDYDINDFNLRLTRVITPPKHGTFSWSAIDSAISFSPDLDSWPYIWDSIQYEVCNNGIPEMCDSAWMIIRILRPPLNADVEITKTADAISFWGDSLTYDITINSLGPDTASVINLNDKVNIGLTNPIFSYSTDNRQTWSSWLPWKNQYDFTEPLIPLTGVFHVKIKAFIDPRAERNIYNKAYITTDILENNRLSDTSTVVTKIKKEVIARAGLDKLLGACQGSVELDANASDGENISFSWIPTQFLDDPTSSTPTFTPPKGATGIYTFILTVTDDDALTSIDTVSITVLPPPWANAGPDMFLVLNEQLQLDGRKSSGSSLRYLWTTKNGHIRAGTQTSRQPIIDSLGIYILTVTDIAGCIDSDTVEVYRFYYKPVAIPDYYSTTPNTSITTENVLYNDFDPNGLFEDDLVARTVVNMTTRWGGKVTINSDGTFNYIPATSFIGVDEFTYEVCNPTPDGCTRGYVKITVSNKIDICNLSIHKWVINPVVLIGTDVDYVIEIKNDGDVDIKSSITLTDSLSVYISNPRYSFDGINFPFSNAWTGELQNISLNSGQSMKIYIRGKIRSDAPVDRIINAAMVSSQNFDDLFDWDDINNRNVDTASVYIESDLIARAELIEKFDSKFDSIIGVCDNSSILSAAKSTSTLGIDSYEWLPNDFLTTDTLASTTFDLEGLSDTTIIFTLIVRSGAKFKVDYVTVKVSPQILVDAGPDKKINEGVPLTLNVTGQGAGVTYYWNPNLIYFNNNPLQPIVSNPGMYALYASDIHGCAAFDTIFIRENQLFALNDILVVITGNSYTGNVATNDYDPNADLISYTGVVLSGPNHGTLAANPPGIGGVVGTNGAKISNNGAYIYTPANKYVGDDYFTYEIHDNNNPDLYVSGKVFIKVIDIDSINSQPVANHDVFFVNKNSSITGNLLANDYDFDGGVIALELNPVVQPQKGVVTLNSDGTFNYKTDLNEVAVDSFYYRIRDNGTPVSYDTTMVYIYINKIEEDNHKPVAVDDAYYVVEKTITGNILLNDYDPDGNNISLDQFVTIYPTNGKFVFTDNYGSFEYTPNNGFEGTDQLIYQIIEMGTLDDYSTTATAYFTSLSEKRYQTDMVVVKSGSVNSLSGDVIEYTITAKVAGPTLVNDVVISDILFSELSNVQFSSDGGVSWKAWAGTFEVDRMMLYEESEILIRAILPDSIWLGLPDTFSVELPNTAWVDHDMTESKPENNDSTWITTVYQKVYADAGRDTVIGSCVEKYELDGSGSIGMGNLQYRWVPPGKLSDFAISNPLYSTTPREVQKFNLIVSSNYNGLFPPDIDTAEVWLEVANSPVAYKGEFWDVVDTLILNGNSSSGEGPLKYLWWQYDKNNEMVVIDSTASVEIYRSGDFFLTVTDRFGCTNTNQSHVGYKIDPFIAVDDYVETDQQEPTVCIKVLDNDIIDSDDDYDLSLFMVIGQPKHGTIIETPGDSCFTYIPGEYFIGYDSFTYIVSTVHGFSYEAVVVVNVKERPAIVPEGFSPNGDGINDVLIIENIEKYELNSIIIFNRWGNVVYKKSKYSNSEPWDGIANKGIRIGQGPVPAGIYLYILDLGDDRVNQQLNGVEVNQRIVKGNIYVATDNR